MSTQPVRLAVLISGNGSNLQAILDACSEGRLPAQVVLVLSNSSEAYGLARAIRAGVPCLAFLRPKDQDRRDYDAALAQKVTEYYPDWVILAGWMRILSSEFLSAFPDRVINLHPALPGTFPGTHAIERAYEAFTRGAIAHTGVMVHLVPDEGVDSGPVLGVKTVEIRSDDSLETLEARIHQTEHRLLVDTLAKVIRARNLESMNHEYHE